MNATHTHSVYSGRATNWPMIGLMAAVLVPFVAMARGSHGSWRSLGLLLPVAVIVASAVVVVFTTSSVRTTAGPKGVSVHFGAFGWPRFRYPLDHIVEAASVTIPKSHWGWGMYWSPRGGLMLTLRTGPALRLTLSNGRKVTISTPTPDAAVTALDDAR